jgi:phosphatidate cytidylyltransferase
VLRRTAIGLTVLAVVVGAWLFDRSRAPQPAWATAALGALVMLGALGELQRFGGNTPGQRALGRLTGLAWLSVLALAGLKPTPLGTHLGQVLMLASLGACALLAAQLSAGPGPRSARLAGSLWFQLPYVGGLGCLVGLLLGGALDYCVTVVLVAKASDTGAYFAGKLLGKHKLAPLISPNKTWEGAVGGLLLPALAGAWLLPGLIIHAAPAGLPPSEGLAVPRDALLGALMGAALGTLAIIADLIESLLKRSCGVKDSSTLLGPAGGFLDLADTLLVVGPVAVAYTAAIG